MKSTPEQAAQPVFRKTIGQTTYLVRVHFDETCKSTLIDKIRHLLGEEVKKDKDSQKRGKKSQKCD